MNCIHLGFNKPKIILQNICFSRIFIECSAKELQGLNRIIEEAVWALIVKNSNPLIAAFMAGAGSMSGNLSSSVLFVSLNVLRNISVIYVTDGKSGQDLWRA